jgi:hypothetical protein
MAGFQSSWPIIVILDARKKNVHDTLSSLVERALVGSSRPLEFYLREHSRLPGPRANIELANDVSALLAAAIPEHADKVRSLVNYFASNERKTVMSNTPAEFVMLCGLLALGACAAARLDWQEETFARLQQYACSPFWRVRECVAMAYQRVLQADAETTLAHLVGLAKDGNYLQQRAAIAAVAEPQLFYTADLVGPALELQRIVLYHVHAVPVWERKCEDFRVLRRALGHTVSVVTAAAPEEGFALLSECATWDDADITWVLRENLRKKRLAKFIRDFVRNSEVLAPLLD